MVEEERVVRVTIPPQVRDGSVIEIPLSGIGFYNFYLRLYVRITGGMGGVE